MSDFSDSPQSLTLLNGDGAPIPGAHDIPPKLYALLSEYYCAVADYWDPRSASRLTNTGLHRRTRSYAELCKHMARMEAVIEAARRVDGALHPTPRSRGDLGMGDGLAEHDGPNAIKAKGMLHEALTAYHDGCPAMERCPARGK